VLEVSTAIEPTWTPSVTKVAPESTSLSVVVPSVVPVDQVAPKAPSWASSSVMLWVDEESNVPPNPVALSCAILFFAYAVPVFLNPYSEL